MYARCPSRDTHRHGLVVLAVVVGGSYVIALLVGLTGAYEPASSIAVGTSLRVVLVTWVLDTVWTWAAGAGQGESRADVLGSPPGWWDR